MLQIPARFDDADSFAEGLAPVRVGEKWGFVDRFGQFVIPPRFDFAFGFQAGLAKILVGDAFGYIGRTGAYVYRPSTKRARKD